MGKHTYLHLEADKGGMVLGYTRVLITNVVKISIQSVSSPSSSGQCPRLCGHYLFIRSSSVKFVNRPLAITLQECFAFGKTSIISYWTQKKLVSPENIN